MLAGVLWGSVQTLREITYQPPRWAVVPHSEVWSTVSGQPQTILPARPLPSVGANGALIGYETGWRTTALPIAVSPTLDVAVKPTRLTPDHDLYGSSFDMAQIMAGGPKTSLYVGVGSGFLAIRTAGVYALSVRFERPVGPLADCLMRLGFGPRRIVSNHEVGVAGDTSKVFDTVRFDLQPGLYPIDWAFGCWHAHEVIGPGRMTLLVGHPGEETLMAARSGDIVRPRQIKP